MRMGRLKRNIIIQMGPVTARKLKKNIPRKAKMP
jgi:hypothetical protein